MTRELQPIVIDGRRFIAGLFWQPLTRPRAYLQEAREIGRRENMDVVAIRKGRVMQAGFARKTPANVGAYSLASALAGILGDDWIGVFAVDSVADRYVIIGTKSGAIIPGCDFIDSRDVIEERLRSDYNLHRFERVFCPKDFGFGGEELLLGDVLDTKKLRREYKLTSLGVGATVRKALLAAIAVIVLVGVAVGFLAWRRHQQEEREAAAATAAAETARSEARAQQQAAAAAQATANAPLPHPWATQPKAVAMRTACVKAIEAVPLSMGGWLVESADCNGSNLQLVFKRTGYASIESIRNAALEQAYQVASIDEAGDTAHLNRALDALDPGGDDTLAPMDVVMDIVKSTLQRRALPHSLSPKAPPPLPPNLPGEEAPPAPLADWRTSVLSITGRHSPAIVMAGIEDLPGVRLTTIRVTRSDSTLDWTLTGEINGK